jgi:hypothetical protein
VFCQADAKDTLKSVEVKYMDGWNPPNDLTNEFNESVENTNENSKSENSSQGQSTTTVTAAELHKLENERDAPVLEQTLTIGGSIEQETHTQVAEEREKRINHITERLNEAQQKLRENFHNSAKRPFTLKGDFNRASSRGRKI